MGRLFICYRTNSCAGSAQVAKLATLPNFLPSELKTVDKSTRTVVRMVEKYFLLSLHLEAGHRP